MLEGFDISFDGDNSKTKINEPLGATIDDSIDELYDDMIASEENFLLNNIDADTSTGNTLVNGSDDIFDELMKELDASIERDNNIVVNNVDAMLTGVGDAKKFIIKKMLFRRLVNSSNGEITLLDGMSELERMSFVIFQLECKRASGNRLFGHCLQRDVSGCLESQMVDIYQHGMRNCEIHVNEEKYVVHECIDGSQPFRAVFDFDGKDIPIEEHRDATIELIEAIARTMETYYDVKRAEVVKKLAIMTSSDEVKLSLHIIYMEREMLNYIEMKKLSTLVSKAMPKYGQYLDVGLPKARFNLRMIGSSKGGRTKRISKFSAGLFKTGEPFLVQPKCNCYNWPFGELNIGTEINPVIYEPIEAVNDDIIEAAKVLIKANYPEFKFRDVQGCFVNFDRLEPSKCDICEVIHDKDNTLYCQIGSDGVVFLRCRRSTEVKVLIRGGCNDLIQKRADPNRFLKAIKYKMPFTTTCMYEEPHVLGIHLDRHDTYICSGWGTGKTQAIVDFIDDYGDEIIYVCISSRRSFSNTIGKRLGFSVYNDKRLPAELDLNDHKRLIIQYESIKRIKNRDCIDVLFIDEIVALIQQIQSSLPSPMQRESCAKDRLLPYLFQMIMMAKKVVCLDNDMDDETIDWVKSLRVGKYAHIVHNTFKSQLGKTMMLVHSHNDLMNAFMEHCARLAAMPEDERTGIAFIAHKKRDIDAAMQLLNDMHPTLRIRGYTGDTDELSKAIDFASPNESWAKTDVVLYNGCLTVGLSCELKKFTHAYVTFNNINVSARNSAQMLFRFRCISAYTMFINQKSMELPITDKDIFAWVKKGSRGILPDWLLEDPMIKLDPGIIQYHQTPATKLWLGYTKDNHRSIVMFGRVIVDILQRAGMDVSAAEPPEEDSQAIKRKVLTDTYKQVKDARCDAIAQAAIIEWDTRPFHYFDFYKSLDTKLAIERDQIALTLGIDCSLIDASMVKKYGKLNVLRGFHTQKLLRSLGANERESGKALAKYIHAFIARETERFFFTTLSEGHWIALDILNKCGLDDAADQKIITRADLTGRIINPDIMPFWDKIVYEDAARVFADGHSFRRTQKWKADRAADKDMFKSVLALINSCLGYVYGGKLKAVDAKHNLKFQLVYPWDNDLIVKLPNYRQ